MGKIKAQDMEDEGEGVLVIRDDEIREQRVGMPAAAEKPEDPDAAWKRLPVLNIYDVPLIRSVDPGPAPRAAKGTALPARLDGGPEPFQAWILNKKR